MATIDMAAIVSQYKDATNNFRDWLMSTYNLVTGHRMFDMSTYDGKLKPALWNDMAEALVQSPRKAARPPNFAFEQLAKAIRFRIIARDHFRDNIVNFSDDPEGTNSYEQHDFFISVLENIWEVLGGPEWEINRGLAALEFQALKNTAGSDTESVSTNVASDFDLNTSGSVASESCHSDMEAAEDGDNASHHKDTFNSTIDDPNESDIKAKPKKNKNKNKNKKKKKDKNKKKTASNKTATDQQGPAERKRNADVEALFSQVSSMVSTTAVYNTRQEAYVSAVLDLFMFINRLQDTRLEKWEKASGVLNLGSYDSKDTMELVQGAQARLYRNFRFPRGMDAMLDYVVAGSTVSSPRDSFVKRKMEGDRTRFFDISTYNDLCAFVDAHRKSQGVNTGGKGPPIVAEATRFLNGETNLPTLNSGALVNKVRRAFALTALEQMMSHYTHTAIAMTSAYEKGLNVKSQANRNLVIGAEHLPYCQAVFNHHTILDEIRNWAMDRDKRDFRHLVRPHHVAFVRMLADDFILLAGMLNHR